jgi:glutathione S-transferase kappa 1
MLAIKSRHPRSKFEDCFLSTWEYSFITHVDISTPQGLTQLLREHFPGDEGEVQEILRLAGTKEYKEMLTANTKKALELGAFGAPWFWMRNDEGKEEPLFGSDRFAYMYRFMGVEFEDVRIVDKKAKL